MLLASACSDSGGGAGGTSGAGGAPVSYEQEVSSGCGIVIPESDTIFQELQAVLSATPVSNPAPGESFEVDLQASLTLSETLVNIISLIVDSAEGTFSIEMTPVSGATGDSVISSTQESLNFDPPSAITITSPVVRGTYTVESGAQEVVFGYTGSITAERVGTGGGESPTGATATITIPGAGPITIQIPCQSGSFSETPPEMDNFVPDPTAGVSVPVGSSL